MRLFAATTAAPALTAGATFADAHAPAAMVEAADQSVANGVVSADMVVAPADGWMVVHRTDVAAIVQEDVAPGDMLMLMVHGEDGGTMTGVFEYTLGAAEDGPTAWTAIW